MVPIVIVVFVFAFSGGTWSASVIEPHRVLAPVGVKQSYQKPPATGFYQYANVIHPGVFKWGYNRGNTIGHSRSQFFDQAGDNFHSAVINLILKLI